MEEMKHILVYDMHHIISDGVSMEIFIKEFAMLFTGQEFLEITGILVAAHLPVMIIEGVVTLFTVVFLKKVQPALLPGFNAVPAGSKMEKNDAENSA